MIVLNLLLEAEAQTHGYQHNDGEDHTQYDAHDES